MNYQKIIEVGNATAAAEYQKSKKGDVAYATFRLGVTGRRGDTTFFPVTVFGKLAESIAKYITKGREVLVEGRISVGEKGYFNIIAYKIRLGHSQKSQTRKPKRKIQKSNVGRILTATSITARRP
jgi:hypothetical protein